MKRTVFLFFCCCQLTLCPAQIVTKADVTVPFDLSQTGHRFNPTWGLDQAWISEQNLRKGVNHMGKENVGIGRSAYRFTQPLINDSALAAKIIEKLKERTDIFDIADKNLPIVFTADQEAGTCDYFVVNESCNVEHWAKMINSHVHWMQQNTDHPIIGISPFNEPDYWTPQEGSTIEKQWQIAKLLRENYPRMEGVKMVGGNTLNDDKAYDWYKTGKEYYDWGNTHQLAGSFDNYANFYQQLVKDGKIGYNDEMHNVTEAMTGLEYGMTVGIWWGFDSRARGEFCDISRHGERLSYGEHRNNWTSASVYRHDDGRVKAFVGTSERQAKTTTYQFVSLDRDVYFDGEGPTRQYCMTIPGGTGYQKGQTNAERVIDITFGADVPPMPITEGVYKLVNRTTGNVAAVNEGNIVMQKYKSYTNQQWNLAPISPRIGGDYSFYDFTSVSNAKTRMDILHFSTENAANVIAWSENDTPSSNEQWYLQYAGDGYYYIRNRESALYLAASSSSKDNNVNIEQRILPDKESTRRLLQWRLLPVNIDYETRVPSQPTGLETQPQTASVHLTWNMGSEEDLNGYMVLRSEEGSNEWNTIARRIAPPMEAPPVEGTGEASYVDNAVLPGHTYLYKVKAIDIAQNQSTPSEAVSATIPAERVLVAHWTMNGTVSDATENQRYATTAINASYSNGHEENTQALSFSDGQWLQLPVNTPASEELTVAMWVKHTSTTGWQRLFDFGYDTDHYLYLTPNNGSVMRLAIKNGGTEEHLDAQRLSTRQWKHVAVTMKQGKTCIYVDGTLKASSTSITISPADVKPVICYLGRSFFNDDPYFNGFMQDVRIYNYALSESEVKDIFNGTTAISEPETRKMPSTVYTMEGIRLQQPRRGLNIVDGKVILK